MSEDAKDMAFDIMDAKDWDAFEKKGTAMSERERWVRQQLDIVFASNTTDDERETAREAIAMAFADAHREGQEVIVAIERAAKIVENWEEHDCVYVRDGGGYEPDAEKLAGAIRKLAPTPPPREQGDEQQ